MLADQTYAEDALSTTDIGRSLGTDYFGPRDESSMPNATICGRSRALTARMIGAPRVQPYRPRAQIELDTRSSRRSR